MRPPLGEFFAGCCAAEQGDSAKLPLNSCNQGYPAGCARFPADGPHAVRFAIATCENGTLFVRWSLERDHRPHECGEIAWSKSRSNGPKDGVGATLRSQLEAYVASYLRHRDRC